jgi:YbbR domain-containing protein
MTWLRTYGWVFLFALFLSFALWIYVSYQENPDRSTSFEDIIVQVQDLPQGLVMVDRDGMPRSDQTTFSSVDLTVRADQETLTKLSQNHLTVFIELAGFSPGDYQVPVTVELNRTDLRMKNFSAIETNPEFVQVRLDQVITKTVPLTVELQGNLPASFERGETVVTSKAKPIADVVVRGPQNRVERVVGAQVVVNIDQLSTNFESTRDLQPIDANKEPVLGVTLEPAAVKVFVPIRSVVGLKRVPVLGHIEGVPAAGYVIAQVRSEPPLITISGSSRWLDTISQVETEALDITNATDVITKRVGINLPIGVSIHHSEVSEILVTVQVVPLLRPFQVELPFTVKIIGNTQGMQETYTPQLVYLLVNGFTTSLAGLNETNLVATVDVTGLSPGTYTLTPEVVVPGGLTLAGELPGVIVSLVAPATPTPTPTLSTPTTVVTTTPAVRSTAELSRTMSVPLVQTVQAGATKTMTNTVSIDTSDTSGDDTIPFSPEVVLPTEQESEGDNAEQDATEPTVSTPTIDGDRADDTSVQDPVLAPVPEHTATFDSESPPQDPDISPVPVDTTESPVVEVPPDHRLDPLQTVSPPDLPEVTPLVTIEPFSNGTVNP